MWSWIAVGYLAGLGNLSNLSSTAVVEFLFFLLPLNFFLYGINDIYDRKSDLLNPRKGDSDGAILAEEEVPQVKVKAYLFALALIIVAVSSFNIEHIALSLLWIALCIAYSHPQIRFKEIPFLDTICSASIYLLPILIAFTLRHSLPEVNISYFILAVPFLGIHAITSLADADADKAAGMKTTGIFLGERLTILFSFLTLLVPLYVFRANQFLATILLVNILWLIMFSLLPEAKRNSLVVSLSLIQITSFIIILIHFILGANFY